MRIMSLDVLNEKDMIETIINTWYAPLIAMVVIWIVGFFFLRYLIRERDKSYNNYNKKEL